MACACIQQLPIELQQSILLFLPDLRSLTCAALSCQALYSALKADEYRAFMQVLVNRIGEDLLPEALMRWHGKQAAIVDLNAPQTTFGEIEDRRSPLDFWESLNAIDRSMLFSIRWDWQTVSALEQFHVTVEAITRKIVNSCAEADQVRLDKSFDLTPPTTAENTRIARTLYRFELYRHILALQRLPKVRNALNQFVGIFAPWEIAQMGCVHDILAQLILAVYDDVAEHDVGWGNERVVTGLHASQLRIQLLVSEGLEAVYRMLTLDSHNERVQALSDKHCRLLYLLPFNCWI